MIGRILRINLEREAVLLIMQKAYDGEYDIYGSTIVDKELKEISNLDKRNCVEGLYYTIKK